MVRKRQKIVLPPELPPEIDDDDVEVSDTDMEDVESNTDYADLMESIDTQSMTKHVKRVSNAKDDDVEAAYEERSRKNMRKRENEQDKLQVDRVDALPTKSLDGKLHYKIVSAKEVDNDPNETDADEEDDGLDKSLVKLTKYERRKKLKKIKRDEKRQTVAGHSDKAEAEQTPQAEVLFCSLLYNGEAAGDSIGDEIRFKRRRR